GENRRKDASFTPSPLHLVTLPRATPAKRTQAPPTASSARTDAPFLNSRDVGIKRIARSARSALSGKVGAGAHATRRIATVREKGRGAAGTADCVFGTCRSIVKPSMVFTQSSMVFTKPSMVFTKSSMVFTKPSMVLTKPPTVFTKPIHGFDETIDGFHEIIDGFHEIIHCFHETIHGFNETTDGFDAARNGFGVTRTAGRAPRAAGSGVSREVSHDGVG